MIILKKGSLTKMALFLHTIDQYIEGCAKISNVFFFYKIAMSVIPS